jgi:hypothetical protein
MPAMSDYLESGILHHIFRGQTFNKPAAIAVALTTSVPAETQTGATIPEVANAGSYARVLVGAPGDATWNFIVQSTGASGLVDNVSAVTFPTATANWGMVSGVAILDSGVYGAGNLLFHAALTTPRDVRTNDTFQFGAGDIDVYLS